jgi:hypothetical protein
MWVPRKTATAKSFPSSLASVRVFLCKKTEKYKRVQRLKKKCSEVEEEEALRDAAPTGCSCNEDEDESPARRVHRR